MHKKSIVQQFKEGLEKLKPMTWKQRIDHIWTYYKAVLLVGVVLVVLPLSIIISFATKKDIVFGGMAINVDMRKVGVTYLTDDLHTKLGANPKKESVELYANAFDVLSSEVDATYSAAMSTIARMESKTLDYIIVDKDALEFYIAQEIYLDLNAVFTKEELAAFGEGNVITITPDDNMQLRIPIAINITETAFAKDCLQAEGEIYFAFVGPDDRAESYRDFWDYFLAWEQTEYHKQMVAN